MQTKHLNDERGSSLVITVAVVATILALLASAVSYTQHVSRFASRTRKTAQAMEIADGHLEYLFSNWRNIYRETWTTVTIGALEASLVGTNYFYTDMYKPGTGCTGCPAPTPIPNMSPSATPPVIPLPTKSNFPSETNYTVTQYRIQAVDPMLTLDANENALVESGGNKGNGTWGLMSASAVPPAAYGPNTWQYSFFYLAAVDVTVPAMTGNVTAKVRRVFEKKFDNPWSYAMFYAGDLELSPTSAFTITGPIHTNGNLYISTSNFTAASTVAYSGEYVNGYSPNDTSSHSEGITAPNFPAKMPPAQVSPFLPFGWDLNITSVDSSSNNDTYHELIERPATGSDDLAKVRYYNQAGYRIVINADSSVTVSRVDSSGNVTNLSGTSYNTWVGNNGQGSSSTILQQNQPLYDAREGSAVKVTNFDVSRLVSSLSGMSGWTGLVYLADAGARTYNADGTVKNAGTAATVTIDGVTTSTTKRAFRLINGYALPSSGLTIVSENPVYIKGNYNTSSTSSATIPSNNGTYTSPTASGYTRKAAAVVADAVTMLSPTWDDSKSSRAISDRVANDNMTVNAALVAGNVPSGGGNYSGGGENFIRFLEDWNKQNKTFCYYGSMVQLYTSDQAIGAWSGAGTVYKSPVTSRWYYDDATFSAASPPGNLQIAAYLQQQRWYQVF